MRHQSRVSVIIVGSSHRDPAPAWLLRQAIDKLHPTGLHFVSCAEHPCDQPLQEKIVLDRMNSLTCAALCELDEISQLLKRDKQHTKPYFLWDQQAELQAMLPSVLQQHSEQLFQRLVVSLPDIVRLTLTREMFLQMLLSIKDKIVEYLLNHLMIEESLLYDKMLVERKIPYHGLEQMTSDNQRTLHQIRNNPAFFRQVEPTRIEKMTREICETVLGKTQGKNTLLICQTGAVHAQRLAANVMHWAQSQNGDFDLQVLPMYCYSKYSEDTVAPILKTIYGLQADDPAHIQALYKSFSTPLIEIAEQPNGAFSSQTFGHVLALARMHLQPDKVFLSEALKQTIDTELESLDIGFKPSRSCCSCVLL